MLSLMYDERNKGTKDSSRETSFASKRPMVPNNCGSYRNARQCSSVEHATWSVDDTDTRGTTPSKLYTVRLPSFP